MRGFLGSRFKQTVKSGKLLLYGGYPSFRFDLLGFGLCRFWTSLCIVYALSRQSILQDINSEAFFLLLSALLLAIGTMLAKKISAEKDISRVLLRVAVASCIAGLACLLFSDVNSTLCIFGLPLLGLNAGLLQSLWAHKYSFLPQGASVIYLIYSMLVSALLSALLHASALESQSMMLLLLFTPVLTIVLYLFPSDIDSQICAASTTRVSSASSRFWKILTCLLIARFVFSLVFNLVHVLVANVSNSTDTQHFLATIIAMLILLAFCMVKGETFSPSAVYKLVVPIIAAGFVFAYLFADNLIFASSLISCGYKLFDIIFWILLFKVFRTELRAASWIFPSVVAVNYLGMGIGRLAADLAQQSNAFSDAITFVVILGGFLLIVTTLVVFPGALIASIWQKAERSAMAMGGRSVAKQVDDGELGAVFRAVADYGMTKREADVFQLLVRGRSYAAIAEKLSISKGTVHTHVVHIYRKMGLRSQNELIERFEGDYLKDTGEGTENPSGAALQ